MTDVADVAIRTARREEAEAIARVIRAAFATVAEKFGDIPPLHERADDILATMDAGDVVLAAVDGDDVVGTVRGETMPDGSIMIRRLAVLPAYRRSGVARAESSSPRTPSPRSRGARRPSNTGDGAGSTGKGDST